MTDNPLYITDNDERRGDNLDGEAVQVMPGDQIEITLKVTVRDAIHNDLYGGFSAITFETPGAVLADGRATAFTVEIPDRSEEGVAEVDFDVIRRASDLPSTALGDAFFPGLSDSLDALTIRPRP